MKRTGRYQPQVKQRVCAAHGCRRRVDLTTTASFVPGVLVDIDLCIEHREEHDAHVHKQFIDLWGVDFVDPERN